MNEINESQLTIDTMITILDMQQKEEKALENSIEKKLFGKSASYKENDPGEHEGIRGRRTSSMNVNIMVERENLKEQKKIGLVS